MNSKIRTFYQSLTLLICLTLAAQLAAQSGLIIIPENDAETSETHELVWETEGGVKYELQTTEDLGVDWSPVEGFPREANSIVDSMPFGLDGANQRFYRVVQIDEQAPEILSQFPQKSGFAIPRFSPVQVELEDVSEIDAASIRIEVGALGTFTVADSELAFTDGILTFDTGGDTALGGYGETISVSLSVADTLGNTATYGWSFDLEREAQFEENLFVFGSRAAQLAGQQVGAIPTRVLAQMYEPGPIRMNTNTDPWIVSSVNANSITISYTGSSGPVFEIGTFLANMTPATIGEIFYRKVTGLVDDTQSKLLTLQTEEVSLLEIVSEGSTTSLGAASQNVAFVANAEGVIERAIFFDENVAMEAIEISYDGLGIGLREDGFRATLDPLYLDVGEEPIVLSLTASELNFTFRPSIRAMLEITLLDGLKRYETVFRGDIETAMVVDFEATGTLPLGDKTIFDLPFANIVVPLPPIGVVPVAVVVTPGARLKADAEVRATAGIQTGIRQEATAEVGIRYNSEWEEPFEYVRAFDFAPTDIVGPEIELVGEFGAGLTLEPYLYTLLYGTAGASIAFPTKGEMIIEVDALEPESGPQGRFEASVGLVLAPALHPKAEEWLNWDPPFTLGLELWKDQWHLFPELEQLAFTVQPESLSVTEGSNVRLTAAVNRSSDVHFQWYKDGMLIPRQTRSSLDLLNVNRFHAGNYRLTITPLGGEAIWSDVGTLSVTSGSGNATAPAGMVFVEGGILPAGSVLGAVSVDTFYIGQYEVTWGEWQSVRAEAMARGYDIATRGAGCADDHPVHSVNWHDVIKWCNLKSEIEGLKPVYSYSGSIYRSGEPDHISITQNLNANGYRLPQMAEWEFAAIGGNQTNGYIYAGSNDLNAVGWYSQNSSGAACELYYLAPGKGTWTVGQKTANEIGLYDMSGNVWEWCWDAYGSYRQIRGGSWIDSANKSRVLDFNSYNPSSRPLSGGFRLAVSSGNITLEPDAGPTANIRHFAPYAVDTDDNGVEVIPLDGSYSTEGDFPIVSYEWKWFGGSASGETTSGTFPVGTTFVTLTVTDSEGNSDSDSMRVTVAERPTQAPTAEAGEDITVTDSDGNGSESVQLFAFGSEDPDGTIVGYRWIWGDSNQDTFNPYFNFPVGTHLVTLIVTDDDGLVASDTVTVTVNPSSNETPVAEAGTYADLTDMDGNGSESITLNGSASTDPDNNIVAYSWSFSSSSTAPKIGTWPTSGVNPTVTLGVGTTWIELTVTDAEGLQDTDLTAITVKPKPNVPPVANAGPDQTLQDQDFDNLHAARLDGRNSSDSDGNLTSYQWSWSGGTATGSSPLINLPVGTTTVTLTVTDNQSGTDTDTVNITITASEIAPLNPEMTPVGGGNLPSGSFFSGESVGNFQIGTYEVTWARWTDVRNWAANNGYDLGDPLQSAPHDHPVSGVSWYDAIKWCNALSEIEGRTPVYRSGANIFKTGTTLPTADGTANGYRLPSEQEWEFAASDGLLHVGYTYSGSDTPAEVGWFSENSDDTTWPVGGKKANLLGLFDMSGNIAELTWGLTENGAPRRGGHFEDAASMLAVLERTYLEAATAFARSGFRLARNWYGSAPNAVAGDDMVVNDSDGNGFETVTLNAAASFDSDGTIATYRWIQSDGSQQSGISVNLNLPVGVTTLYLMVEDNDGARDLDSITITVESSSSPDGFAPASITYLDASLSVTDATYSDDLGTMPITINGSQFGSSHHYEKVSANAGEIDYSASGYTGTYTLTFTSANAGTFYSTYTGPYSGFTSGTFTINTMTSSDNTLPMANAGEDQLVTDSDGNGSESVTVDGSASSDSDGSITNYTWSWGNGQSASGVNPTIILPVGDTTVELTVTDDQGDTATDSLVISVQAQVSGRGFAPDTLDYIDVKLVATDATWSDDIYTTPSMILNAAQFASSSYDYRQISDNVAAIDYFNRGGYNGTWTFTFTSEATGTYREDYTGPYNGFISGTFEINSFTAP